jgi:hypothetical protein
MYRFPKFQLVVLSQRRPQDTGSEADGGPVQDRHRGERLRDVATHRQRRGKNAQRRRRRVPGLDLVRLKFIRKNFSDKF